MIPSLKSAVSASLQHPQAVGCGVCLITVSLPELPGPQEQVQQVAELLQNPPLNYSLQYFVALLCSKEMELRAALQRTRVRRKRVIM